MKARNAAIIAILIIIVLVAIFYYYMNTVSGPTIVMGTQNTTVGTVLTDGMNKTLYTFSLDSVGNSTCYGSCASEWPPFLVSADSQLVVPSSVSSGIGAFVREGQYQITYNGMPLYTFANDIANGDVRGNGLDSFGGNWSAVVIG